MTNQELKHALKNNMFASLETMDEAFEYVDLIARASPNALAVWTALHVLMNTISNHIEVPHE